MSQYASQQLDAIHSMLSAGQRNLRIERHSLMLWGIGCGGLILISDHILTPEQLPDLGQRALAWLTLLSVTLFGLGLIDWRLTRRVKQARDEAWSFIHRQVMKVWWLLMALGALMTFAMFFFGGGYMVYAVWLALIGLGLYIHGLFSEEVLEWVGTFIIAIAVAMPLFHLDYTAMQQVSASTLGLGLPLLAWLLDRGRHRPAWLRLAQALGWLLCVLIPPLLAQRLDNTHEPPPMPTVSLEEFRLRPTGAKIVALPAGSHIPVKIEVSGDLFQPNEKAVLPLVLAQPLEIVMQDGQPSGDWRRSGANWEPRHTHWLSIPWMKAEITPQDGPRIRGGLVVETHAPR